MSPENSGVSSISRRDFFASITQAVQDGSPVNYEALKSLKTKGSFTPQEVTDISVKLFGSDRALRFSGQVSPVDNKLRKTLKEGPSSLIDEQIIKNLEAVTSGNISFGRVPIKAWLLNPPAAIERLRLVASQAATQTAVGKVITETAGWMAKVAGDDAKRDALLNYNLSLEKALGPYVGPFCKERNLSVPEQGTIGRMTTLLRINAEMRAVQERGSAIARRGETLVRKQVAIQADIAEKQMLAKELPRAIEVTKEINGTKEALITEKVRNALASLTAAFSGGIVGVIGGFFAGAENSVSTLIERHPKVAIPLGVGVAIFTLQLVSYSGTITGNVLEGFALKGLLVTGVATVATGIGAGFVARMRRP